MAGFYGGADAGAGDDGAFPFDGGDDAGGAVDGGGEGGEGVGVAGAVFAEGEVCADDDFREGGEGFFEEGEEVGGRGGRLR